MLYSRAQREACGVLQLVQLYFCVQREARSVQLYLPSALGFKLSAVFPRAARSAQRVAVFPFGFRL